MGRTIPMDIRFNEKFVKTSGCWKWIAAKYHDGYGIFWDGERHSRAHRVAYSLFIGEIPEGMLVCHHCDNPACVNPKHLFLGTIQDNVNDRCNKGHSTGGSLRGENSPSHKYTEDKIKLIRGLYDTGRFSQRDLAKKLNIPRSTIKNIVNRDTWKHI
jgi:hypothetical protein